MRVPGRKIRPAPKTDMQERLRFIQERADAIHSQAVPTAMTTRELGYLVAYLARIVEKHLQTKEE